MKRRIAVFLCMLALTGCGHGETETSPKLANNASGEVVPGDADIEWGVIPIAVFFDTDSTALLPDTRNTLQKQAKFLTAYPNLTVTVEGHADERGTREYNLALGERRAQATMNYLIALGIGPNRLKTISYGKERPLCREATEACWRQNRRTVSIVDN